MSFPAIRYMPQLDGLRAIAVTAVLAQHWFEPRIKVGTWGVTLFFVISGYLISRTLLDLRDSGMSMPRAALHFFGRRSARLFPAYTLTILIALLLFENMRPDWLWYAGYASNFLLHVRQAWIPLTPTWSLALEEQFYLAWFLVPLLATQTTLRILIMLLIVLAPTARLVACLQGDTFAIYLPWMNGDALAAGALLSVLERARSGTVLLDWRAAALLLILAALCAWRFPLWDPWFGTFGALVPSAVVYASVCAVAAARHDLPSMAGALLRWQPLVYCGRISYGIYLYHMLTPRIAAGFENLPVLWRLAGNTGVAAFVLHLALTIAMAAISYRVLEMPLRNWLAARLRKMEAASP